MTSAFSGSYKPGVSIESRALQELDPQNHSFVNRDFVKNIAWLNQSVGTLSRFTEVLQKGVEAANQDIFATIDGLINEIIILFNGGSPTGFDFGDLGYIFQAWGAMFGINPGTPFPLNILEAVEYLFTTWLAPSEQFTDVLFDAQYAWAEELGLSQEYIDALHAYQEAVEALNLANVNSFYQGIHDILELFTPQGEESQEFWRGVTEFFEELPTLDLKPVIAYIMELGIPFIDALTSITNNINSFLHPGDKISASQIQQLSANLVPVPSQNTKTWSVGSNALSAWVYDSDRQGFRTTGTGTNKRVLTEHKFDAIPGQTLICDALVDWDAIPGGVSGFGMVVVFYLGNTEKSSQTLDIPSSHSSTATDISLHSEMTVPDDVDGMRIGAYVNTTINSGQVWMRSISVKVSGLLHINWIYQLQDKLDNLIPFDVWFNALQVPVTSDALEEWIQAVLTPESWLDAGKLLGSIPQDSIDWVPISSLLQDTGNFLKDPNFSSGSNFNGRGIWTWDSTEGYHEPGSARCSGEGIEKALLTTEKVSAARNSQITVGTYIKWSSLAVSGSGHKFAIDIVLYKGNQALETIRIAHIDSPGTNSSWTYMGNDYVIENPDTTSYRVRLVVTAAVTSGLVWFDNAVNKKSQLIALDWIDGAIDWFNDIGDRINALLQDAISAINGFFDPDGDTWSWIGDLGDALGELWNDAQDALADAQDAWENSELAIWLGEAIQEFAEGVDAARVSAELWLKQLFDDIGILIDFFHLSYPVGHPSNGPNHTEFFKGSYKRTYWAAWNSLMIGLGWAKDTSAPTIPLPSVATKYNELKAAIKSGADGSDAVEVDEETDIDSDEVKDAIESLRNSVTDASTQLDAILTTIEGANQGQTRSNPPGDSDDWGDDWTLYGGTGKSTDGKFQWVSGTPLLGFHDLEEANANEGAQCSLVTATANQVPWLGSSNANVFLFSHADARSSATDFVFSKMYAKKIEFGYYVDGTWTVLNTYNSAIPFSSSARLQHTVVRGSATNRINYAVQLNGKVIIDGRTANALLPFSLDSSHKINGMGMIPDESNKPATVSTWTVLTGGTTVIPGSLVIAETSNLSYTTGTKYPSAWSLTSNTSNFALGDFEGTNDGILFKDSALYAIEVYFFPQNSGGAAQRLTADQQVRLRLFQNNSGNTIGAGADIVGAPSLLVDGIKVICHTFVRPVRGGSVISAGADIVGSFYGRMSIIASKLGNG